LNVIPLTQLAIEQLGTIRRVIRQEPALLRYLSEQNLVLSTQIEVISKAPFNGPINIRIVGSSDTILSLGREVADKILVLPLAET
jgi:Fe2+ transport system protein FeoA